MALPYLDHIAPSLQASFESAVRSMATRLGVLPEWIVLAMYRESGLKATAVNPSSGATGLIQFLPSTASKLGTTTAALRSKNVLAQLPYVETYLRDQIASTHVHPARLVDLYLLILYPAAAGKPSTYVLFRRGTTAYKQNSSLNPYGDVTVGDVAKFINQIVPSSWQTATVVESTLAVGGILAGMGFAYVTYNQFFNSNKKSQAQ